MLPILGKISLLISLICSLLPTLFFAYKDKLKKQKIVGNAIIGQSIFCLAAFILLLYGYIISDFSIENVYRNSHISKPIFFKIGGLWANHEGSILLWAFILSIVNLFFFVNGKIELDCRCKILSIQSIIYAVISGFIIFVSNPFIELSPAPLNGKGLNPLLQDIGLLIHPPTLYIGYVTTSIAFSCSLVALLDNNFSTLLAKTMHKWTTFSWIFLTIGIALGSSWAYRELGWGGFWFWDPVENVSLMPWLLTIAFLHVNNLIIKRNILKSWGYLLAICAFLTSILGTFLVRSGVLVSVHSFANDPARGIYILGFLSLASIISLTIYALKAPYLTSKNKFSLNLKENGILLNVIIFFTLFITILIATIYPILHQFLFDKAISVGAPYFIKTFLPILFSLIIICAIFSLNDSKKTSLISIIVTLLILAIIHVLFPLNKISPFIYLGAGIFLMNNMVINYMIKTNYFTKLKSPSSSYNAMIISHIGFALLIISITIASSWDTETSNVLKKNETLFLSNFSLKLEEIDVAKKANYITATAKFLLKQGHEELAFLHPEQRFYVVEKSTTSESSIYSRIFSDIYANIEEISPLQNIVNVKLYYKPFMNILWFSVFVLALGGIYSLKRKKL